VSDAEARAFLMVTLEEWTGLMKLPTLAALGVGEKDFGRVIAQSRGSSMKTNPLVLSDAEIERILRLRFLSS